jgi:phenylalanyl-tRNA synthetase beta chain
VKFSLQWLREFVDIDVSPEELGELLSHSGTKLETLEQRGKEIHGVIVARVLDITDHPNADNLTLVEVDAGDGRTERVVCGARNFSVGDLVPLAAVGARLPGGLEIGERKIRGEVSRGMLCSPMELGVSRDHAGILVLPTDASLGSDVPNFLGLDDAIYEVEITPNRGDCMGMIGIAREVAALVGNELRMPSIEFNPDTDLASPVEVDIQDPEGCRRFVAQYAEDVTIAPSPSWMQARLLALGVRPISNVVDITNYVMLETGQPLHAYDAAKLAGTRILVRRAAEGEKQTTLDGQERVMHPDDLMIADPERLHGIAGVMGGEYSEVSDDTTNMVLECANFDHASVAFTMRRHGIRTEAGIRFERGADPEAPPFTSRRAMKLMAELAGARVSAEVVDEYPKPWRPRSLTLRPARTDHILGYSVPVDEQVNHLRSIAIEADLEDGGILADIPSFRNDLQREIDLVEEVARLAGFDRLPTTLPRGDAGGLEPAQAAERRVRRILVGLGLSEAWTSSFSSPAELDLLGLDDEHPARRMVQLENPTSDEEPALRTTLMPGLLRSAARNIAQRAESVALFEVARLYEPSRDPLPREELCLGAVFCGRQGATSWRHPDRRWDFYSAKGVFESLLKAMEMPPAKWIPVSGMPLHPTRAASINFSRAPIGVFGEVHPVVCERFDVPEGTVVFEIGLEILFSSLPQRAKVEELSRFPAVYRDVALVVNEGVEAARIEDIIRRAGQPEVESVRLFDVYRGEQVPEGKKSLAYALNLRSRERTLTDEDADAVRTRILTALEERTGAQLRS